MPHRRDSAGPVRTARLDGHRDQRLGPALARGTQPPRLPRDLGAARRLRHHGCPPTARCAPHYADMRQPFDISGSTDPATTDPGHSGSVVTTPVNGHDSGPAGSLLGSPGSVTFANARVGETSTGQRWPGDVNFCCWLVVAWLSGSPADSLLVRLPRRQR